MKKYFLSFAFLIVLQLSTLAQLTQTEKLDSLRRQALILKGQEKIDCLNLLALTISTASGPKWMKWDEKADSVYHYASIAYQEASKIGYDRGTASALTNLADYEWLKGIYLRINKKDDAATLKEMENYLSQAIPLAEKLQDHEILGYAYELWSDMVYSKSKSGDPDARAEYFKKAIDHFHRAGNDHKEGEDCLYQAERYMERGYYEKAIEYLQRALELNKKSLLVVQTNEEKDYSNYLYQQSLADMADLYKTAGDYETALSYLDQSCQFALANNTGWDMELEKAEIFHLLGQYDSSFYYLKKQRLTDPENKWVKIGFGTAFLLTNEYDSALQIFNQVLPEFNKVNVNGRVLIPILLGTGSAYAGKNEYTIALPYAREGLAIAMHLGMRPQIVQGYELLSNIHRKLGNNDSAYQYLLKYSLLKDSVQNRQFLFRLNNYKKAAEDEKQKSQLLLLNKDNKLKAQQLQQEALIRKSLLVGLFGFILIAFFIFRALLLKRKNEKLKREKLENEMKLQQLENEKKHAELQQQAVELEMQALRAQMNPHFIFNCLSSINRFILKNEGKTASNYLVRFSRLIRMVLINSQKPLVTLEDELQMLTIYLDMERLRFKDSFDYGITFLNTMETGNIFIPPLLLQPFCENAIWHGLMHKEGQGRLNIEFSMKDNILNCTIADNGIGLEKSEDMKSKSAEREKSMGLKITTERLALLNREKGVHSFYDIENILDEKGNVAGTKINLKIGYKEREELLNT